MKIPPDLISFFKKEKEFLIATHINPEPDAIGSALALSAALESMGKKTVLYDRDGVPEFYRFLPGYKKFKNSISSPNMLRLPLVLLDCNTPKRAGIERLNFKYSAVIDHHETESTFGDIRWIEPRAAATGIMIFYLIKKLGVKLTEEIAVNLYAAVAIDTGTFRYSNTTAEVFNIAAQLVKAGANPAVISQNLYETWSEQRFLLLCMALGTLEKSDSVAVIHVTKEMFDKTRAKPDDTENFVSFPRMMKDVKISAFFREENDNNWKISLRSKGDINVATIAKLFKGGGHKNAAGFEIKGRLKDVKKELLQAISQHTNIQKEK